MTEREVSQELRRLASALVEHAGWSTRGATFVEEWDGVVRALSSGESDSSDSCETPASSAGGDAAPKASEGPDPSLEIEGTGAPADAAMATPDAALSPSVSARIERRTGDRATQLAALREGLLDCRLCRLAQGRTQVVFGVGDPEARALFVGEGPGRDEDLRGEPFVGKAGQLLTDIIEKGMRLRRSEVYISNVVKCRPPANRDPELDEIAACHPFLARQIEIVAPEVIVSLGRVATQALLATDTPISRLRGRWHEYAGIPLMPTLHPAYLLRNPGDKRLVWADVKQVMERLGLPIPGGA